jgi:hypothetical protein
MKKWLGYIVIALMCVACGRRADEMLSQDLVADSLRMDSLLTVPAQDSDITYAPVAVASSSLVDASGLMSEDTTSLPADTVEAAPPRLTLSARLLRWLTTPRDSALRAPQERFATGCNFEVVSDSLRLRQWPLTDEVPLQRGDEVVVAERMTIAGDSADVCWVKLARDQYTMGWVPEDELPPHLLPDDSVSRSIYFFSHAHGRVFVVVLGLFGLALAASALRRHRLHLDWFRRADSVYATLLTWLLATTAFLYALIQRFFPDVWQQFYYHPSFNPLDLAPLVALFVLMLWLTVWVGVAVADELWHQARLNMALLYGLTLLSYSILLYVLFTFLPFCLGWPAWVAYSVWSGCRLRRHLRYTCQCGRCGAKLRRKGVCPVCGALNE